MTLREAQLSLKSWKVKVFLLHFWLFRLFDHGGYGSGSCQDAIKWRVCAKDSMFFFLDCIRNIRGYSSLQLQCKIASNQGITGNLGRLPGFLEISGDHCCHSSPILSLTSWAPTSGGHHHTMHYHFFNVSRQINIWPSHSPLSDLTWTFFYIFLQFTGNKTSRQFFLS